MFFKDLSLLHFYYVKVKRYDFSTHEMRLYPFTLTTQNETDFKYREESEENVNTRLYEICIPK